MEVLALAFCTFAVSSAQFISFPLYNTQPQQQQFQQQQQQQQQFQQQQQQQQFQQQQQQQQQFQQQQQYIPVIGPLGVPLDTREVQAARAIHLDIFNRFNQFNARNQNVRNQNERNQDAQRNNNANNNNNNNNNNNSPVFYLNQNALNGNNRMGTSFMQQQQQQPIYTQQQVQQQPIYTVNAVSPSAQQLIATNSILQDTPEVAAAKVQHFQVFAKQAALASVPSNTQGQNGQNFQNRYTTAPVLTLQQIVGAKQPQMYRQRRSLHIPIIGKNGVPIDTQEVQLARAQHLIAHHEANNNRLQDYEEYPTISLTSYNEHNQHIPIIGPKGVPIETPEVQIAKAKHFLALANANSRNSDYNRYEDNEILPYRRDDREDEHRYKVKKHQHYYPNHYDDNLIDKYY